MQVGSPWQMFWQVSASGTNGTWNTCVHIPGTGAGLQDWAMVVVEEARRARATRVLAMVNLE